MRVHLLGCLRTCKVRFCSRGERDCRGAVAKIKDAAAKAPSTGWPRLEDQGAEGVIPVTPPRAFPDNSGAPLTHRGHHLRLGLLRWYRCRKKTIRGREPQWPSRLRQCG